MSKFELRPPPAYDSAPTITMVDDEVVIVGPGAVAFSMTREAARETHRRLGLILGDGHGPLRAEEARGGGQSPS